MRKILFALTAMGMFPAAALADRPYVFGQPNPNQVVVRVGSPEFSVRAHVPFPNFNRGCGYGRRCGGGYPQHRMHRHGPGCGHPMPVRSPVCGGGCQQPHRMPQGTPGVMPSINCEAAGGVRTVNPNTGMSSCFVPG